MTDPSPSPPPPSEVRAQVGARVAIALGANLGDRAPTLDSALRALDLTPGIEVLRVSSYLETDPVGPGDQGAYLNAAAVLRVSRTPRELLTRLQAVERAHGRDRSVTTRWGPRTLDLDIILFGDRRVDEPGLTVPHPEFRGRAFVLEPLAQIAPEMIDPASGRTVADLLSALMGA